MIDKINTFTDFLNEDKRIIRDTMDKIIINFDNKYQDKIKDVVKKDISNFIDDSMDDLYNTIINILEKKDK